MGFWHFLLSRADFLLWHFHPETFHRGKNYSFKHIPRRIAFVHKPAEPKPAPVVVTSAPAPAPATKPPVPSWVTQDEIEAQRKLGRTLLIYSADELIRMEASDQNIGLFLNKWVKINYKVAAAPFPLTEQKKEFDVVEMTEVPSRVMSVLSGIAAYFDPKKWGDKLINLREGDYLMAVCQLQSIDRGKPTGIYGIRRDVMVAVNCELL